MGEIKLDDICDAIVDCEHKTAPLVAFGYPSVRTTNIKNGRIDWDNCNRLDPATYEAWTRRRVPAPGDLILAREAPVGEVGLIPEGVQAVLGQRTVLICPDHRKVDSRYLHFLLISPDVQTDMLGKAAGSTVEHLNMSDIRALPLPELPPLPEQRAIARVLGGLDDKIELNRRMNRTLEDLARALFNDWLEHMESELATVTTQSLTDSGVLVIGDGYRAKRSELRPTGLPFARAGNINGGFQFKDCEYMGVDGIQAAGEKVSRPLDSVFTSKGTVGRLALVSKSTPTFVYAPQLCFWRAVDSSRLNPYVLHQWMHGEEFGEQVDMTKGQTDMADYVSLTDQRRMRITLPSPKRQAEVGRHLERLYGMMDQNTTQIGTFAALRDSLLPVLLSGELRLHHVSAAVEEVLA